MMDITGHLKAIHRDVGTQKAASGEFVSVLLRRTYDAAPAATSPEAREFSRQSVRAWVAVIEASGTASAEEVAAGTEMAMAQFAPEAG
jgi:hypothetical protein